MRVQMRTVEGTFEGADGLTLFERAWLPEGEARAVVVIVHGYAEHSGRYEHVGKALTARGYAVEALDLRGHGRSEGDRATVRSFSRFLADLRRFIARVRARHPGLPLFVLGHSMGGTIVSLYAINDQPEVAGIVLSGPAVVARGGARQVTAPIFSALGRLFPNLPLSQLKAETVSRDPAVVAAYDSDPLVYRGKMRAGLIRAFTEALKRIDAGMETISPPILLLHGTADELAPFEGSQQLALRARSMDRTLKLYEGLAHEVLNEPEKDEVIAELLGWLDLHRSAAAAAAPHAAEASVGGQVAEAHPS
jgi:alpha-beta hydrolase superfamily lysophospholipase